MSKNHVHILTMGGTIEFFDPDYDVIRDLMKLDSSIEHYFSSIIKPHFTWNVELITQKDSRDLQLEDRMKLQTTIEQSPHDRILVTHGTFTMAETAQFIEKSLPEGKTVVFTGSMIPIAGFTSSDAGFNIGFAIASMDSLRPGVYLSMNGGVFSSDEVSKNRDLFRFE